MGRFFEWLFERTLYLVFAVIFVVAIAFFGAAITAAAFAVVALYVVIKAIWEHATRNKGQA